MKTKRNNVTWESESSIKLLYVKSHITPHLQSFVHGSPTFLQEQHPEHYLSALHSHFVGSLDVSDILGCVIQHRTKLFPFSIPIYLGLVGSALVSSIEPSQTLLDTWLCEHVALMNIVCEVSSWVVSCIEGKAVICIYLLHIWLMLHDTLNRQIFRWYSVHFRW